MIVASQQFIFFPQALLAFFDYYSCQKKILAFFTLKPAFEWQVGYNGMRPNLSISYGSNDKTQFSIPQVLNLAAGGIVRPVLLGVGSSGSICKEIIQKNWADFS